MKKMLLSVLLFSLLIPPSVFSFEEIDIELLLKTSYTNRNDTIFYNIGLYYLKQDENGKAIKYLKRANLLNPYDRQIKSALNYSRGLVGIPDYMFESTPLEKVILFPFTIFSLNGMIIFGLLLLLSGSVVFSYFLSKINILNLKLDRSARNKIIKSAIIIGVTGIIYLIAGVMRYSVIFKDERAVAINSGDLIDRPGENASDIDVIQSGIECRIDRELNGFYLIYSIDGKEGWVDTNLISRIWKDEN